MNSSTQNGSTPEKSTVWLVTGTSTGFGRQLVLALLKRGDFVIATARRVESIQDFPKTDNIRLLQLDVDWETSRIKTTVDQAVTFWGRIDVLCNNAGSGLFGISEEVGSQTFRKQFQTNLFGLIDVTNATLPYMRDRKSGTVVMMGSRTSWSTEKTSAALYGSSKAALRAYSETLAVEIAPFSIRVLIVEPAAFRTEFLRSNQSILLSNNPIPAYDEIRQRTLEHIKIIAEKLPGDPRKAMEVLVDVVKGEGKAQGRPWPLYLLLGPAAGAAVKEKADKILKVVEEWRDVTSDVYIDSDS